MSDQETLDRLKGKLTERFGRIAATGVKRVQIKLTDLDTRICFDAENGEFWDGKQDVDLKVGISSTDLEGLMDGTADVGAIVKRNGIQVNPLAIGKLQKLAGAIIPTADAG